MKFVIELSGTKILMDAEQINTLTNMLYGLEQVTNKYIGASNGTKSHYLKIIEPFSVTETLKIGAMADEEYDATVLVTKLQTESNA
jgi:hypothetical protein